MGAELGASPRAQRQVPKSDGGILRWLTGRAPARWDEATLTPAAVRRLGADVGGSVRLADGSRTFRVVGTVEDPSDLEATTVVLRTGALPPAALAESPAEGPQDLRWLAATPGPLTWAQVKQLNTHGVVAVSRHVLAHPPSRAERYPELAGENRFEVRVPLQKECWLLLLFVIVDVGR